MQFKTFIVSEYDEGGETEALNKFLRTHKILQVQQQLVQKDQSAAWYFSVQYMENSEMQENNRSFKTAGNPEENLSADELAVYIRLKEARAKIADEEKIKRFIVFSNEELSKMAKLPELTADKVNETEGIAKSKKEKYAAKLLEIYEQSKNETQGQDI